MEWNHFPFRYSGSRRSLRPPNSKETQIASTQCFFPYGCTALCVLFMRARCVHGYGFHSVALSATVACACARVCADHIPRKMGRRPLNGNSMQTHVCYSLRRLPGTQRKRIGFEHILSRHLTSMVAINRLQYPEQFLILLNAKRVRPHGPHSLTMTHPLRTTRGEIAAEPV